MLPTTLFGRHPGWGAPGGTKTPPKLLREIWDGVAAQDITFDAIMTGYMGDIDHVALAVDIIKAEKMRNPDIHVLIDPVMGDHGRLYIPEDVARAIITDLLPLATIVTPNLWELDYLTGDEAPANTIEDIAAKASTLSGSVIVTSVEHDGKIGTFYKDSDTQFYCAHRKFSSVPNGGGDSLAAVFLAHRLNGLPAEAALARATASIFTIIEAAQSDDLGELPLVRMQEALISAPPLSIMQIA